MFSPRKRRSITQLPAFTLVELLVVLFILLMLSTIALPTVKRLLADQKASRAARNAAIFIDAARNRAIAENRYVGVRLERLGIASFGQAASIRMRQLVGIPPYTGDSADALATLQGTPISSAVFQANDCPLLALSSRLLNNESSAGVLDTTDDHLAPIRIGDLLELPGGRSVPITAITDNFASTDPAPPTVVTVTFDLNEPNANGNNTFPGTVRDPRNTSTGDPVKFRIHRRPVPSSSTTFSLPRGLAFDMNYSGIGIGGNQFSPDTDAGEIAGDVDIVFDPNGSVISVTTDVSVTSTTMGYPVGKIYLCLGDSAGVMGSGENLFQNSDSTVANIRSLDSIWIVINPASGQVSVAPFATANTSPTDPTNPRDTSWVTPLAETRSLANASATLDSEP
ncbi:secreted protein [Rhodopirellula maiorica SM1]|uniref:Secreted protein n=1 Tax=Rhodopirellula maiorica SM1 TaxID=1265738 RepID=M5RYT5_9BACT|nr:secreted protein [Rhodopirellula maiorica]EMI20562.1 secreted protein [Rhodopirellula maiorica SM1]